MLCVIRMYYLYGQLDKLTFRGLRMVILQSEVKLGKPILTFFLFYSHA